MMKTLVLATTMLLISAAGLRAQAAETALNGTLNISTGQTVHAPTTTAAQTGVLTVVGKSTVTSLTFWTP